LYRLSKERYLHNDAQQAQEALKRQGLGYGIFLCPSFTLAAQEAFQAIGWVDMGITPDRWI
jgi:hypothetical protein